MLILLDRDGIEVMTLPYDEAPDTVITDDNRRFDYEATQGDEHIYREVD